MVGQRMDFYAMIHAFGLIAVMYRRRRKAIAEIWPKYCCFLACLMTFQYFVCIGIPPAACKGQPSNITDACASVRGDDDADVKPCFRGLMYSSILLTATSCGRIVIMFVYPWDLDHTIGVKMS